MRQWKWNCPLLQYSGTSRRPHTASGHNAFRPFRSNSPPLCHTQTLLKCTGLVHNRNGQLDIPTYRPGCCSCTRLTSRRSRRTDRTPTSLICTFRLCICARRGRSCASSLSRWPVACDCDFQRAGQLGQDRWVGSASQLSANLSKFESSRKLVSVYVCSYERAIDTFFLTRITMTHLD